MYVHTHTHTHTHEYFVQILTAKTIHSNYNQVTINIIVGLIFYVSFYVFKYTITQYIVRLS